MTENQFWTVMLGVAAGMIILCVVAMVIQLE
jgi:hypothetical protein